MAFIDLPADHPGSTAELTMAAIQPQPTQDQSRAKPEKVAESPNPSTVSGNSDDDVVYLYPIDHADIRMPNLYKEIIGPLEPRRLTFSERHANFAAEPRDVPWAVAMETGINNYVATVGAERGIVSGPEEFHSEALA